MCGYNLPMSTLAHQIQQATGQRGRLEAILQRLEPEQIAELTDSELGEIEKLAAALLQVGAFAQVLELQSIFCKSMLPGQNSPLKSASYVALCSLAGTAAANLGLSDQAITNLEAAAQSLNPQSSGKQFEQVFASLGRLYKQRGVEQIDSALRLADLQRALIAYERAFKHSSGVWGGVNVATLKLLLGDEAGARAQAIALRALLDKQTIHQPNHVTAPLADHYRTVSHNAELQWQQASLGEIALLLGQSDLAKLHYDNAAAMAHQHRRFADIASMRRLILQAQGKNLELVDYYLAPPKLIVFSGHRLDQPGAAARFTAQQIDAVRAQIDAIVKDTTVRIAYTALSEGADVLFAQAALDAGVELNVVLSTDAHGLSQEWQGLGLGDFEQVIPAILAAASKVYALAPEGLTGDALDYRYANEILLGSALLRAAECDASLRGLAVWDGQSARGVGGTASMVQMLQARMPMQIIYPDTTHVNASSTGEPVGPITVEGKAVQGTEHAIKALLFADFVGFSKLSAAQTAEFVGRALPLVAQLIREFEASGAQFSARNTWGDGLFLVFDQVTTAAEFALDLQAKLALAQADFSFSLRLRIALHCAPVMLCQDPISQRPNAFGPNVSRAARLEPATAPGAVYSSEAFAAQFRLSSTARSPRCRYLAHLPWAKGYGTFPTFIIER
jgi:class 3 adenylate cyclase/tetratricopeptide (TPR) repeat protein